MSSLPEEDDYNNVSNGNAVQWTNVLQKQLRVTHTQLFHPNSIQSREIFKQLEDEVKYLEGELSQVKMFGRWCPLPRKQAVYGDPGITYSFTGHKVVAQPWTPILKDLRHLVEQTSKTSYNLVFVNRYENGKSYIGEHRDSDRELDPKAPIASLTFGSSRDFYFKHASHRKGDKSLPIVTIKLEDGLLLLMHPPTNKFWYHSLPVERTCKAPRINLTFRRISP